MLVTERGVAAVLERLSKAPRLVVDTETTGLYTWHGAKVIGVSVCEPNAPRSRCYYFPFRHKQGQNLSKRSMIQLMGLISDIPVKTFWNAKFDVQMLEQEGMTLQGDVEDVMLLFHLIDENQNKTGGSYELKNTASKLIDPRAGEAQLRLTNLLADRGLDKGQMAELLPEEVAEYASDDVYYTEKLRDYFLPLAEEWSVSGIWREVNEYSMVTRLFEQRGLLLDVERIQQYRDEAIKEADKIRRQINKLAGFEINLRSNPQMQKWLGLRSTAADYITEIEWTLKGPQAKAIKTLQKFRQWDKVLTAYYNAYLEKMDANDVLHPNIKLHGTISGRPSAENPNLQAIPVYNEVYKVKDVFIARPGHALISADYGQMELRFGAHYAQDAFLIECFKAGRHPHKEMLAQLLADGVDISYEDTKRVNFAIMYGTGARTLSKELKKPEAFAQSLLNAAHALHPHYKPFLRQVEEVARKHGYLRMWTGRVRHFNTLPDPQPWFHRGGSNLIQGGVAEVMRHAITRLSRSLPQFEAHMLLQVHDQILVECPTSLAKTVSAVVRGEMTRDFDWCSVPFVVDIKTGSRWGQLKEEK